MSEAPSNPGISESNTQNQAQIPTQAPAPNSVQDQLQAQNEHLDAHAAVLITQFLSKTRQIVTSELGGDFRCTICSEGFLRGENPEVPIRLDCGHVFGMSCILKWLSPLSRFGNNSCPNCRAKIFDDWNRDDFPVQQNSASRRRRMDTSRVIQFNGLREGQSRRRFEAVDETENPGRSETDVPAPRRVAPARMRGTPDLTETLVRQHREIMQRFEMPTHRMEGRLDMRRVRETDETENPGQGETDVRASRRDAPVDRQGSPDPVETAVREHEEARQRIEGLMQRIDGRLEGLEVGGTDGTPARRLTVPSSMRRTPGPTETPVRQREDTMQQSEGRLDPVGVSQVEYDAVREAARYAFTRGPRVRLQPRAPRRLGEVRVRQRPTDSGPIVTRLEVPIEGRSIEAEAARESGEATTSRSPEVAPTADRPSPSLSPEGVHQGEREDATAAVRPSALPRQNPYSASLWTESNQRELESNQRELASSTGNQRETYEARRQELLRRLNISLEAARRLNPQISAVADTQAPAEAASVAIEDDNGIASMFTAAETEHDLQRQQEATNKRKHHMWMQFCEGIVRSIEQSTDSTALANHDLALTIINMANLDEFIAERASESPTWRRILQTFPRLHTEMVTRFNDFRPLTSVNIDHRLELERLLSSTHFHLPTVHQSRWLTRLSERLARGALSSNHDLAVARLTERVAHLSSPFRESERIAWPEGSHDGAGEHLTSEEGRQMQRMEDYLLGRTPVGVRWEGAASVGAALREGAERSFAMTVVARL